MALNRQAGLMLRCRTDSKYGHGWSSSCGRYLAISASMSCITPAGSYQQRIYAVKGGSDLFSVAHGCVLLLRKRPK